MTDIKSISEIVSPIAQKYGADRVALFGSRAKNTSRETSDYDFVISRGNIASLFQLAAFIGELEKAFGGTVDVITDTSNDVGFLAQIKKDEIVVYEAKDETVLKKRKSFSEDKLPCTTKRSSSKWLCRWKP